MAIVKEYYTKNGAHVIIRDDCYAGVSEEEMARRRRHLSEVILEIDRNWQERMIKEGKDPSKIEAPRG